jgi:TonB-linked SusC/RagA family outer membrane protein
MRRFTIFLTAIFSLFTLTVCAQTFTVKGRVTNETGQAVEGASVVIKGTSKGVSSDNTGAFSITTAQGDVLVVTSVGYTPAEITVSSKKDIVVTLSSSTNALEQVVVVGYGSQRKKDVTGSVVSVSETTLREVPSVSLPDALQGKAAGLEIQNVGTSPGAGTQIRIRGTRSISGSNAPLIILDGIPYDGDLNDINPDDVASIDILKDASATAIYGSRGSNGVILVTTKRGKPGETRVSVNTYQGIGSAEYKYPVFNAVQYQAMRNASPWTQGYQPLETQSMGNGTSTNWQNLMYQNSYKTDNNINIYGGAGASTYSLGAGYYHENAILPGQDFTRYSVRATIDTKIGKRIKIGLNSLNNISVINGSQFVNSSTMFPVIALSPLMPAYVNGKLLKAPDGDVDDLGSTFNPLLLKHNNNDWVDRITRVKTFNSPGFAGA